MYTAYHSTVLDYNFIILYERITFTCILKLINRNGEVKK